MSRMRSSQARTKCQRFDRDVDDYNANGYETNSESSSSEDDYGSGYSTSKFQGSVRPTNKNRYPEPNRYRNIRKGPTLGIAASRSRMRSQQMDNYSSTTYSSTNLSSSFSTTNDTTGTDKSELYTPIDRSNNVSRHKSHNSRGLLMEQNVSPIRPSNDDDGDRFAHPFPPPLGRFHKNFRPQHTSTTTSIKPMSHMNGVPKIRTSCFTGSSGMVTSTPRSSISSGVPPLTSYNQVLSMTQDTPRQRPNSYYAQSDYNRDVDYLRPASSRSVPDTPDCYKPENYGLNACYAKKSDLTGIVYLKITLTGKWMVSIDVSSAVYFFNPPNKLSTFITVEKRSKRKNYPEDDKQSSRKRETSSRKGERRQARHTETIWNCNRPEFKAKFDIKLGTDYRKEAIFLAAWSVRDSDPRLHPEMIGCMTFDVKRLFRKAQDATADYYDENMSKEIVVCDDGYFFLDQKLGERKNMPQNKLQSRQYYGDLDGGFMTNSSHSSGDMAGSSKMPMEEFVTASRNFGQSLVPGYSTDSHIDDNLNFSTASSSTNSGVMNPYNYHLHRNTLPSITTTSYSSSNNEGISGISGSGPNGTTDFQHLYVDPSQCDGRIPKNHIFVRPSPSKKEASVRRAASFTYSPKGSGDKLNKRQVKEEPREFLKKMSFNPIQKTLSFLRNKMDGSNSSIAHPSKEDVTIWKTSFESLLRSRFGNQLFRQFLNKEMSVENLDFWESCEEFRNKWKDDKKSMTKKANEIYQKFITEQAPNQVNLDCATREATKAALHSGCEQDTFSLSQNIIEKLMETDSYKRFLKDAIYLDVLRSFDSDNNNQQKH